MQYRTLKRRLENLGLDQTLSCGEFDYFKKSLGLIGDANATVTVAIELVKSNKDYKGAVSLSSCTFEGIDSFNITSKYTLQEFKNYYPLILSKYEEFIRSIHNEYKTMKNLKDHMSPQYSTKPFNGKN